MATLSAPSRNPFRSNVSTPNVTGTSVGNTPSLAQSNSIGQPTTTSPPPTFSASDTAPSGPQAQNTQTRLAADDFDVGFPLEEEPPPYTMRPSATTGETIIEQGPRRPFQPAPSPLQPRIVPNPTGSSSFSSPSTPSTRPGRSGGLLQQLTNSLNTMVDNISNNLSEGGASGRYPASAQQQSGWSGYPGQQTPPQTQYAPPAHPPPPSSLRVEPPPRHPSSSSPARAPSISPSASSEFARDFYAAGGGEADAPRRYAPPPGPPPPPPPRPPAGPLGHATQTHRQTPSASSDFARDFYAAGASEPPAERQVPDDGRPTTVPAVGHPLLKDGKILVYPKRHECDKCHNVGYKSSDPQRPCKKCWSKYAKPYTGPIVYSFSNTTPDSNFQRPLRSLPPPPPPPPRPVMSPSSPQPHFARGGYMAEQHTGFGGGLGGGGGFHSPPPPQNNVRAMGYGRPPPGSVVYTAGDPRIGGELCWRCEGRGSTSFLILDRITCEVCGGIGRTF